MATRSPGLAGRSCRMAALTCYSALVRNSGFDRHLEAVLSVDEKRVFKPDSRAYELVEESLGLRPDEVVFVSSNGFDVSGAASSGFRVARIERVTPAALRAELAGSPVVGPGTMYKALRTAAEAFGDRAEHTVSSLRDLVALAAEIDGRGRAVTGGVGSFVQTSAPALARNNVGSTACDDRLRAFG